MAQQIGLALEIAIKFSPDVVAVLSPGLVLELALDVPLQLARALDLEFQFNA